MATCICTGTPLVCMAGWDTIPESFLLIATTFVVLALARHLFGGTVSQAEGAACGERAPQACACCVWEKAQWSHQEKWENSVKYGERNFKGSGWCRTSKGTVHCCLFLCMLGEVPEQFEHLEGSLYQLHSLKIFMKICLSCWDYKKPHPIHRITFWMWVGFYIILYVIDEGLCH